MVIGGIKIISVKFDWVLAFIHLNHRTTAASKNMSDNNDLLVRICLSGYAFDKVT